MKKTLLLSGLIILLLSAAANAQLTNSAKAERIVFINRFAFGDDRTGVKKYAKAVQLAVSPGYILPEIDDAQRKEAYEKHYRTILTPVENEISAFLKKIEEANNLEIWNITDFDQKGEVLSLSDQLDFTAKTIDLLNLYFMEKREPILTLAIPETKIAVIDTGAFSDEKTGIAKYQPKLKQSEAQTKFEIGRSIQTYSEKNGFGVVFDSGQKLPARLQNFQIHDITKDFISYYNLLNP